MPWSQPLWNEPFFIRNTGSDTADQAAASCCNHNRLHSGKREKENKEDKDREEEEEAEPIRAKPAGSMADSFEAGADVETQLSLSKGRGSPLPDPVRAYMEPRFGMDFSQVHIHTGSDAIQMNKDVGAQAFTHGSDIYFGEGSSPANLELTAHELTHVVQQNRRCCCLATGRVSRAKKGSESNALT